MAAKPRKKMSLFFVCGFLLKKWPATYNHRNKLLLYSLLFVVQPRVSGYPFSALLFKTQKKREWRLPNNLAKTRRYLW